MAPKQKMETHSVVGRVRDLAPFRKLNYRTSYGTDKESKEMFESLRDDGWDRDKPLVAERFADMVNKDEDWKAVCVAERTELWTKLKEESKTNPDRTAELYVFEQLYVENGKIIHPQGVPVTGNRRLSLIFGAFVARHKLGLPIDDHVVIIWEKFENEDERLYRQLRENELAEIGRLRTSPQDQLRALKRLFDHGATQSDLRRAVTGTTGQKMWGIFKIDKRFPDFHLFDRLLLPVTDPQYVDYGKLDGPRMPKVLIKMDQEALAEKNRKLIKDGDDPWKPMDADQVAEFLFGVKEGKNEKKVMKGENIRELSKNNPVDYVRRIAADIAADRTDTIDEINKLAPGLNAFSDLAQQGDYPMVEKFLIAMLKIDAERRAAMWENALNAVSHKANKRHTVEV